MSKAVAAQTTIGFIAEVTENTTPATPALQIFRATGESLAVNRKFSYGSELNGLRPQKNFAIDTSSGGGGFDFEFTFATLEAFLASLLYGAWSSDVLIDGTTPTSFTFETKFETGGTDMYKRLTGAYFSEMTIDMKAGARVTGKASVMAMSGAISNAAIAGATYPAGNAEPILVGADMGALALSGLTFDQLASISLTIKNTLTERYALGTLTPVGIGMGQLEITGSIGMYVDSTMYNVVNAAQGGTATGLTLKVGRTAAKKTQFELPNLILEAPVMDAKTPAGDVMCTMNFRALQDTSALSGHAIRVTRNLS